MLNCNILLYICIDKQTSHNGVLGHTEVAEKILSQTRL